MVLTRHVTEYSPPETGEIREYPRIFPNFQNCACSKNDLKDNKHLYNLAKHLITKPSAIAEEKKQLSSVLVSNGYPSSFGQRLTKTTRGTANQEPTQEFKLSVLLPYVKGVSEVLRCRLQQRGIRTVLKSETILRSY